MCTGRSNLCSVVSVRTAPSTGEQAVLLCWRELLLSKLQL